MKSGDRDESEEGGGKTRYPWEGCVGATEDYVDEPRMMRCPASRCGLRSEVEDVCESFWKRVK